MAMGRHCRWRGAGRRGGRHPWGVAGRFDAGVVAERGTGAAQHGDCPERGAISRTGSTRREDRINRLRRAVVRLCFDQSGKRLQELESTVDRKKWVAGGDSQGLLIAGDSNQSVKGSIQDFTIRAPILGFVGGVAGNRRFSGEWGCEPRRIFKDNAQRIHIMDSNLTK